MNQIAPPTKTKLSQNLIKSLNITSSLETQERRKQVKMTRWESNVTTPEWKKFCRENNLASQQFNSIKMCEGSAVLNKKELTLQPNIAKWTLLGSLFEQTNYEFQYRGNQGNLNMDQVISSQRMTVNFFNVQ